MKRRSFLLFGLGAVPCCAASASPSIDNWYFLRALERFKEAWDSWAGELGDGKYNVKLASRVRERFDNEVREYLPRK